jgi:MaoC dehydratase-like protein/short subunit dehydrogenase
MTDEPLASRSFTWEDQFTFARMSCDLNPIHLDANFARRTQAGAAVVHGIHTLLWAMETVLPSLAFDVQNIKVRFAQPLYPDEVAEIRILSRTETAVAVEVLASGTVVAAIKLSSMSATLTGSTAWPTASVPEKTTEPMDIPFEQMAERTGAAVAAADDDEIRSLFPAVSDGIGPAAVHALLATSQIVGMACPGLHSLFAGLNVSRDAASERQRAVGYAVNKTDARFRSLQLNIRGSGLIGRLDAFARLPPPIQPGMAAISTRVRNDAFAGQRALIVGGSRGLGEVTARIIAAGGGVPVITYREGQREAEAVAADIRQAGGQCHVIRYDALEPATGQLAGVGTVSCCFYFATARIFQRKSSLFESERLRTFLRYYADGFFDLCTALAQASGGRIAIFYPSTAAIDQAVSGAAEYAMAKAAGETLATYLNALLPSVHVVSRRLPRIMTDQTATIGVAAAHDALDVMLPIVYDVVQAARP